MGPAEFVVAIRKGKKAAVYFLRGPERYLHQVCREAITNAIPAEAREWCLIETEFEPGRLRKDLEGANQMPMLGGHCYLYCSDPEDFKRASDEDYDALQAYLEHPSPFATVVIAAIEPDKRRRLIQLLEKKAQVVHIRPMTRGQAAAWAREFLKRAGVEIAPGLAEEVAARFDLAYDREPERSGVNLLWMRTELEKALTAKPGAKRLERQDLELIAGLREDHQTSGFLHGLADRRCSEALERLRGLLAGKTAETLLLWCIADLVRQALKLPGTGGPRNEANPWRRSPGTFPSTVNATLALEHYSRKELLRALRHVREADLAIKSSWKDSKILLEFLVWRIITGKATAPGEEGAVTAWQEESPAAES